MCHVWAPGGRAFSRGRRVGAGQVVPCGDTGKRPLSRKGPRIGSLPTPLIQNAGRNKKRKKKKKNMGGGLIAIDRLGSAVCPQPSTSRQKEISEKSDGGPLDLKKKMCHHGKPYHSRDGVVARTAYLVGNAPSTPDPEVWGPWMGRNDDKGGAVKRNRPKRLNHLACRGKSPGIASTGMLFRRNRAIPRGALNQGTAGSNKQGSKKRAYGRGTSRPQAQRVIPGHAAGELEYLSRGRSFTEEVPRDRHECP